MRRFLNAKIHRATITEANIDYEGSITIPPELLEASGIFENEAVWVWDVTNGARFETYVICGKDPLLPGERAAICVNGAAARLVAEGDIVIIASFCLLSSEQASSHQPQVVFVDTKNRVQRIAKERAFAKSDSGAL